jgi:hypothetical protein
MQELRPPNQPNLTSPPQPAPRWPMLRSWHVRLIGLGLLVVIVLVAAAIHSLDHKGSSTSGSSTQNNGAPTSSTKADEFTYNGVTYEVTFTGVDLAGQSAQSATGLNVNYTFTIKSEPANLDRTPDSFVVNAAVPKSDTTQCGVMPTPDPNSPTDDIGTYFMPVTNKSGWCQMDNGANNAGTESEQADDPNSPSYSTTPQEVSLTGLIAPVDRTKVVLVVTPVAQTGQQWILPYQAN